VNPLGAWRDKVVYLALIDRFANGDKANDDFGKGEYDPKDDDCFHGGDLKGLTARLPFLKAMGYDAVWVTPPVHNQWVNPYIKTKGFHGYWAYDFTAVDPHFGTLADYKAFVAEAHRLGLKVIQDIVVNHTGNFFTVDGAGYDPARPELNWKLADGALMAPKDPVFGMNDPNNPEHKRAAVYNFTPNIADFKSREQTLSWTMGDLDDINLKSPLAVKRFKEVYKFWIDEAGVDGFRVDTVYYTPEEFYERFLHDDDGIKPHAAKRGKKDFFVFGEVWSYDAKAINAYIKGPGRPRLDAAVDLPLNEALTQVFYRKAPTERLKAALKATRANRHLWVNFLDNHDIERMSARAGPATVRQSLAALFTLPGLPCVYYGTEAGLTGAREDFFDDKKADLEAPLAKFLRSLIAFRKANRALSRGKLRLEKASAGPGLLAWSSSYKGERLLSVFNTAPNAVACDLGGEGLEVLLSSAGRGSVPGTFLLEPDEFLILKGAAAPAPNHGPTLTAPPRKTVRGTVKFDYALPDPACELSLLDNGDHGRRVPLADPAAGSVELDTTRLGNGRHELRLLSKSKAGLALSAPVTVTVRNPYRLMARAKVPADQKGGLGGIVRPPADPSYRGQLSLSRVDALTSGRDLKLRLRMTEVTDEWNPPHGFDHVYFSVFFDFPGVPGKRFLPKLGYAPGGFDFNAGFLLYGWDMRSFGAEDSTPASYGKPLLGDVAARADKERNLVEFTFSSGYFAPVADFSGLKVFISTWDGYLGELRAVAPKKEDWNFYTTEGPGVQVPKVYDHVLLEL
jgi:glycosidase